MNKPLSTRVSVSSPLSPFASQRGAVSVAAALSLTALMGVGAMAVDVGNVMVARNDVQNAADAAALRGAGLLYTQGSSSPNFSAMNNNPGGPVYETANLNTPIEKQDTLTVKSNYWQSISSSAPSNDAAVRVSYTKQVNLFFAGILGMKTMSVTATSTAIVQNSSVLGAGGTHLPIAIPQCAISQYWNSNDNQPKTDQIQVGPTHTCNAGGNGNQENQNNQENQGNQQDNQQQQRDNQQQQNDSENSSSSLRVTKAQQGTRHAAPLMNFGVSNHPHLVRMAFTLPGSSALQYRDYRSGFVRVEDSGANLNGSANTVTGTGAGAGGPGNGNGPGQGAGQGLGAGASVGASVSTGTGTSAGASVSISIGSGQGNSCITGQFSTLTSQPDDSNFSHSEHVAQDGNPEDLHVGDQIDLENGDYSNSQDSQGSQGNSEDRHHQSQRESHQRLAQSPFHSGWIRADHLAPSINSMRFSRLQLSTPSSGFLRVDQQGDGSQNHGNDNNHGSQNQGNDNNQGNQRDGGDPYTTINNCSAAGNHSCEYSIVPVVESATSVPHGKQTIVGFACLHVLSAANGTINATLSMGCVSNSSASVASSSSSSSSSSSAQTSYGVVSPPRLAR